MLPGGSTKQIRGSVTHLHIGVLCKLLKSQECHVFGVEGIANGMCRGPHCWNI